MPVADQSPAGSPAQLPPPRTAAGQTGLRALLDDPGHALIAVDFDGTLAPIVADPADARPQPGAAQALAGLASRVGTVAVLTGRPADVAAGLLGLGGPAAAATMPRLIILGHYGLQRWTTSGGLRRPDVDTAAVEAVRIALPELLATLALPAGVSIEDKGESLAVHVRRSTDPTRALEVLRLPLQHLAAEHGLRLEPGRMVLELRLPGVDKGMALEELARDRSASAVVYAGDDLGDLAAFDAVDRLAASGVPGLKVCSGSDEVAELVDRADVVVDGPRGVVAYLAGLAELLG